MNDMHFPKWLERQLSIPGILIFHEKHGDYYYICNTKEDFCKAAMHKLKARLALGYWYHDDELDEEQIAIKEAAAYCGTIWEEPELYQDKTWAEKIVATNDIEQAYVFMHHRSDHEYEGMTIERGVQYD